MRSEQEKLIAQLQEWLGRIESDTEKLKEDRSFYKSLIKQLESKVSESEEQSGSVIFMEIIQDRPNSTG